MILRTRAAGRGVAVCAAALVGLAFCGHSALAQKSSITMGATNATSSNYALAVAMSKAIKQNLPNANVTVIETGASVDNIRRMSKGEIDFGLTMVDTNVQAAAGSGPFKDKAVTDIGVLYVYDVVVAQRRRARGQRHQHARGSQGQEVQRWYPRQRCRAVDA